MRTLATGDSCAEENGEIKGATKADDEKAIKANNDRAEARGKAAKSKKNKKSDGPFLPNWSFAWKT